MTDLTEQWKKGELPEGFYFVSDGAEITIDYYLCDYWERHFDSDVQQVLAPVPSYGEWQASEKYNKHLEEKIKIYERKDKQATETSIAYNELAEENAKLKEEYKAECHRADELEDSYWKEVENNKKLKDLLNSIRHQCEVLIPKNGLAPVSEKSRLCKAFLNLIDEVLNEYSY